MQTAPGREASHGRRDALETMNSSGSNRDYFQFEDINHAIVRLFRDAGQSAREPETVLDIGCGRARLGLEIERLEYRVTGIDKSSLACAAARDRITEVIEHDIMEVVGIAKILEGRQFDWLMAADILEHCPNPEAALRFYRRFLKPDGRLLVSLPNVAVWDNRCRLLFGRFNYTDSGVMDRTHLRFFTFRSARELVLKSGFTVERTTWEPGIVRAFVPLMKRLIYNLNSPGAIVDSPAYRFYSRYLMPVEHLIAGIAPGLLAFRTVMLAHVSDCAEEQPTHQNRN
jgi:2-polyprenyl-3-methyl-5-hydroxy-6-metoxy-1,4-benzoquinol methylase